MKQSFKDYVEGRLAIGGCCLTLLIIAGVIALIILIINRFKDFFNDIDINWPILLVFIPIVLLGIYLGICNSSKK